MRKGEASARVHLRGDRCPAIFPFAPSRPIRRAPTVHASLSLFRDCCRSCRVHFLSRLFFGAYGQPKKRFQHVRAWFSRIGLITFGKISWDIADWQNRSSLRCSQPSPPTAEERRPRPLRFLLPGLIPLQGAPVRTPPSVLSTHCLSDRFTHDFCQHLEGAVIMRLFVADCVVGKYPDRGR